MMEKIIKALKSAAYVLAVVLIGLAKGVGEHSKSVERAVNKSTLVTKELVNKAALKTVSTPQMFPAAAHAATRIRRNNSQASSNPCVITCFKCNGKGQTMYNGYPHRCTKCNGTGKIVIP